MEVAGILGLASDQRLAEHVTTGSDRAFEVLYDRHHKAILGFCRNMLGSLEEAEDALQHTFMAAYRDLRRSGPPAAVRPWLFVIARNRCISVLRARRELPAADVPERMTDRLATDLAVREELRAVFAGLARLPDDQRAALVLTELGDVSHDEIARILDCRTEQVKSYVYQARSALAADRLARDTSCADIRVQLAELRGGALRRTPLRRHLDDCPGCRAFRETLRAQRRQLRALLPVAPALGLKRTVLGAVLGGSGGGGVVSVGGVAATALIAIAIPVGGVAVARDKAPPTPAPMAAASARGAGDSALAGRGWRAPGGEAAMPDGGAADGDETRGRDRPAGDAGPRSDTPAGDGDAPRGDTPLGEAATRDVPAGGGETRRRDTPGDDEAPARHTPASDGDAPVGCGRGPGGSPERGKAPSAPDRGRTPEHSPGRGKPAGRGKPSDGTAGRGKPPGRGKPSGTASHPATAIRPAHPGAASPPAARLIAARRPMARLAGARHPAARRAATTRRARPAANPRPPARSGRGNAPTTPSESPGRDTAPATGAPAQGGEPAPAHDAPPAHGGAPPAPGHDQADPRGRR